MAGHALSEFVASGNGQAYIDAKTAIISRTGHYITFGKVTTDHQQVTVHWSTRWRFHSWNDNLKLSRVDYDKTYEGELVMKPGETKTYRVKEQYEANNITLPDGKEIGKDHPGTGYMAGPMYIDDINWTFSLQTVKSVAGVDEDIADASSAGAEQYTWVIQDTDGKDIYSEVSVGSRQNARDAKNRYVVDKKITTGHWQIRDSTGAVLEEDDITAPKGEFPWIWVAVAVAVIAVVAVILLLYMRSGHTAPAGVPAAAPVPAVTIIQPPAVA